MAESSEKEKAMQAGFTIDVYIDQALKVFLALEPVSKLKELVGTSKEAGFLNKEDNRFKAILDTWLTMFDEMLKAAKSLPVDLIGKAADSAKGLRDEKSGKA